MACLRDSSPRCSARPSKSRSCWRARATKRASTTSRTAWTYSLKTKRGSSSSSKCRTRRSLPISNGCSSAPPNSSPNTSNRGEGYENVRKIYSINIVYFNLGNGTDIVYHGKTQFRGIHNGEVLSLSPFQQQKFNVSEVSELYPEYYILKVNDFNRRSKVPLEQWIYFLNTGEIPDDADAPGLDEARSKLKLATMSKAELNAYYRHLDNTVILRDNITTARGEGKLEGRMEGLEEGKVQGIAEAKLQTARKMKGLGMADDVIAQVTGLPPDDISRL